MNLNKKPQKLNLKNFNFNWKIEEEDESNLESNISKSFKNINNNPLIKLNEKLFCKPKLRNKTKNKWEIKLKDYLNKKINKIKNEKNETKLIQLFNKLNCVANNQSKMSKVKNRSTNSKIKNLEHKIDSLLLKNNKNNKFKKLESNSNLVKLNLDNIMNNNKDFISYRLENNNKKLANSNKTLKQKKHKSTNYFNKEIKDTIKMLKLNK